MKRLDEVKKTVLEISGYVKNGISERDLRNSYKDFVKLYPSLFKIILENKDFMEVLDRMLDAAKRIESGEYTPEEMDKLVGEELAKKYVYPHIDMLKEN